MSENKFSPLHFLNPTIFDCNSPTSVTSRLLPPFDSWLVGMCFFSFQFSAFSFNPACAGFSSSRLGRVCKPTLRSLRSVGSVFQLQAKIEKLKVFRFNPASQAFPPSHLGRVQTSLPSALGLSSVPFSTTSENRKTKSFPLSVFRFQFFVVSLHPQMWRDLD